MRTLTSTLLPAQQSPHREPYIRLTFSLTGEDDVVIEQDRILTIPSQEEMEDSQKAEIVFNNSDGYFTSLDFKGWQVVMEWGLKTTAGIEYSALPPMKVVDQDMVSSPGVLRCTMSLIGVPNLLASDKASADYSHHWSDPKTVKTLIAEILFKGGTLTNLTGTATGSPIALVPGTNTVIVTGDGTFTVVLPVGSSGRALSGTATVTSSPVALVGGSQTITVSGGGAGKTITIMTGETELTEQQITSSSYYHLDHFLLDLVGQLVSVPNRTITKIAFRLKKTGSPSGNVTFRLDSVASGTLASKTYPCSSIGTDPAWHEVTLTTPVTVDESIDYDPDTGALISGIQIFALYQDGDVDNYVSVSYKDTDVKGDEFLMAAVPGQNPEYSYYLDCAYKYKYRAAGISVFSHCPAYEVVYDSEDSLIDTYAPGDGFRVDHGSSRLDAIIRLLRFTGCRLIVKADGKIHVLVPTTALVTTWTSPTGFTAGPWINEANAYDGDTGTEAYEILLAAAWTDYIELTHAALSCDQIKFYAQQGGTATLIDVDVYDSVEGVWADVYQGTYTELAWVTKSLDRRRTVTKARIRFYQDASGTVSLFEFAFGSDNYDSVYSLVKDDHQFWSKSVREALVVPNKITVHSYPDDDDQYSGYYTDSESYALIPKEDFIRAKLTSNDQATAIATAMIGQLQMNSERGSAIVPINLGSEIFDYVKVTDSRQVDSRTGNIGYIRRSYTPGKELNMVFSFSKLPLTGIGIGRIAKDPLRKRTVEDDIGVIEDSIISQADTIDKIREKLDAEDDETPVSDQITEGLIGYLKHLVEDNAPKLGGTLNVNSHNVTGLLSTQTPLSIAANTDYQNTGSYPILISVCFDAGGQLKVGASATPTTVIASIDDVGVAIAIVPIGWYYRTNAAPAYAFEWSIGG